MQQWIEDDQVCRGTKLHYYRTGNGSQAMLLLHGITGDGSGWKLFTESLAAPYTILMPDMKAHGKSEAPEDGYTLEIMAAELAALLTSQGLMKCVILGHSFGGTVALVLAGLYPQLVQALLLEDPPPFWDLETDPVAVQDHSTFMLKWVTGLKRKTYDELLDDERKYNPTWPAAEFKNAVDSKHRFDLKITRLLDPTKILPPDTPALIRSIKCPALFIQADTKAGALCDQARIAKLQALMPQLEVAHISGAGHNIRLNQPERYREVVRNFMDKINIHLLG